MKKLYTIRDVKAAFGCESGVPAIIDCANDEVMLRIVKASLVAGQKPNALNVYPEDKEVWCVGEFDERTGKIKPCMPYLVARAIDYLTKEVVEDVKTQDAE